MLSRAVKAENTARIWLFTVLLPSGDHSLDHSTPTGGGGGSVECSSVSEPREEEKEGSKEVEQEQPRLYTRICSLNTFSSHNRKYHQYPHFTDGETEAQKY